MKNCVVRAEIRPGRYWRTVRVYFIDNGNGTWYVDGWDYLPSVVTEAQAQSVMDEIKAAYDKTANGPYISKSYDVEDITAATVDSLMASYDNYTWAIDSLRQQEAAEANNRWILQMCGRIRKALNLELATA